MHWGTYSQWGIVESWSLCSEDESWCRRSMDDYATYKTAYEKLQTTFNPVKFDPERWAKAAHDAGMRYVVFTTKHHDGFSMFDTRETDYRITSPKTPFSTNPRADVTKAHLRRVPRAGVQGRRVLLEAGLAQPGLLVAVLRDARSESELRHQEVSRALGALRGVHARADRRADVALRPRGHPLARRRLGAAADRRRDQGARSTGPTTSSRRVQSQDIDMPRLVAEARAKQPGLIVVDRDVPGPYQNYLTPEARVPPAAAAVSVGSADADGAELVVRAERHLQVAARADSDAGGRRRQGRQSAAQHRPRPGRRVARRGVRSARRAGRVDEGEQRGHLRHAADGAVRRRPGALHAREGRRRVRDLPAARG